MTVHGGMRIVRPSTPDLSPNRTSGAVDRHLSGYRVYQDLRITSGLPVTRPLSQIDPETSHAKTTRHADDPRFASAGHSQGPQAVTRLADLCEELAQLNSSFVITIGRRVTLQNPIY
jgi:hypothetical protein